MLKWTQNRKNKEKKKKRIEKASKKESLLAPSNGYTFTTSYIKAGNNYGTILKIVNNYGMNRKQEFGWFVNLIPEIVEDGVKGYFIEADKLVPQKEERDIMRDNVPASMAANQNTIDKKNNANENDRKINRMQDLSIANSLYGLNNKIVDWKICLLLVSKSPDAIERQIDKLKTLYDERILGVKLMSYGGDQEELLNNLFDPPEGSVYDYTSMTTIFAGNDHALRKGLNDPDGYPIGSVASSYSSGEAFFALDRSFKKKILIAGHKESRIIGYNEKISAPSMWGQLVANNAMVHGHKTFHIVLNNFKYFGESKSNSVFACNPSINKVIKRQNMASGGLNPLQMFGSLKDVTRIFNDGVARNGHIMNLLADRSLSAADIVKLKSLLEEFYIERALWHTEGFQYKERIRITQNDSEKFPTYGEFIAKVANSYTRAKNTGTETDRDRASVFLDTLKSALSRYGEIFNTKTSLPSVLDKEIMQYYYDLSDLRTSPNIMEAQFLNIFDYVAQFAHENDIVMIHGLNQLSVESLGLIKNSLDALEEGGVRLAYIFDNIKGQQKKGSVVEKNDIFNTDGVLYEIVEKSFDYTILSTMSNQELDEYQKKLKKPLSKEIRDLFTSDANYQFQVRRPADYTSNFIQADFLI